MCLHVCSDFNTKNDDIILGYKVFRYYEGNIRPELWGDKKYELGKIYTATNKKIHLYGKHEGLTYDSGFHIFKTIEGAIDWIEEASWKSIYEVHGWDIRAKGKQGKTKFYRVDVCKKMRIIKKVHTPKEPQ